MEDQYTRWQTRRRSLPDQKKSGNGWILGKSCLELISLLKILENTGPADRGKNKSPALIAYLCGFPESGHVRKTKLRLTIN